MGRYPNPWLSGEGRHVLEYAIVAHDGAWETARIPRMAWEYNCPPCPVECGGARPVSFPGAGGKVIVAAMCRDREDLEVGLAECFGRPGTAHVTLALPHRAAALTNLTGGEPKPLEGLVPPAKRAMLKQYSAEKGHPPRGV